MEYDSEQGRFGPDPLALPGEDTRQGLIDLASRLSALATAIAATSEDEELATPSLAEALGEQAGPVILFELGPDEIALCASEPFSIALVGIDPSPATRFMITRSVADAISSPAPSLRPTCLAYLEGVGSKTLLVDLVAASMTSVTGSDAAVEECQSAIARQVAVEAFGPIGRVIVVGPELRSLATEVDVVAVTRVEDALEVLRRLEGGGRSGDGTLATLVVVSKEASRGAGVASLVAFAERRSWLCVLLPVPVRATRAVIAPANGEHDVYLRASSPSSGSPRHSDSLADALLSLDPPVEVAVLGQIEIRGAPGSLERRPKLTELIVYLAMHPEGATSQTWQSALWPDKRVPGQTVANRLSEARRLLGMELDGSPRLRKSAERHRLAGVTTDWERFRALSDSGRDSGSWRTALELVRGRPFDDLQEGHWTVFEGFCGEIENAIIECALRYGEERLEAGDPDATAWAAQRALRANPYDERLWRLLMLAADAAGSGVETIYRNLVLVLDIEEDGGGAVHPETAALYERLTSRRLSASA